MKFVIRDDDACAFTSPDSIRACYQRIWTDIPVSLSVTPFRVPGNDRHSPPDLRGSMEEMPLEGNAELVSFMREAVAAGRLDITLHGYQHWRCNGLPEFVGCEDLAMKAKAGKAYLERLLGAEIRTFVPPNNGISRVGLEAVIGAGMNLAGSVRLWSPKQRRVSFRSLAYTPRVWWHRFVKGRRFPYVLDLGDHEEVSCHTVGPRSNLASLRNSLEHCRRSNGVFVLATHYHAFDRKTIDGHAVRKVVYELIDEAVGYSGTEFVGFNSLWKSGLKSS